MKRCVLKFMSLLLCGMLWTSSGFSQSFEMQQLILNVQKLNQLRAILSQLKEGYEILSKGYQTIKNLSQGNFNLHQTFLDGLLAVSPTVRKYKRISEIITEQKELIRHSRKAMARFSNLNTLNEREIIYLESIYSNILSRSSRNIDELLMVITAGELRMNDAERLDAIDRIYTSLNDKLTYVKNFNHKVELISTQRNKELLNNKLLEQLYK